MHNLYRQFRALLPHAPLQVGTVVAAANGVVEGLAPNLPLEVIDI